MKKFLAIIMLGNKFLLIHRSADEGERVAQDEMGESLISLCTWSNERFWQCYNCLNLRSRQSGTSSRHSGTNSSVTQHAMPQYQPQQPTAPSADVQSQTTHGTLRQKAFAKLKLFNFTLSMNQCKWVQQAFQLENFQKQNIIFSISLQRWIVL